MRYNPLRKALLAIILGLCGSFTATAQEGLCHRATFYADLRTGLVVNGDPGLFNVISPMTPSGLADCGGWNEMVVEVNIPKECTTATVTVGYQEWPKIMPSPARNWTLNIGDSPTNNGYAGDAGTTVHNAELWIVDDVLELADAGNSPPAIDSPRVANQVALKDGGMQFLIKNQFVSWGHPYQLSQSNNLDKLFAIPDTTQDKGQSSIYVGLNRVIYGPGGRTGCGLRTAVIAFQ